MTFQQDKIIAKDNSIINITFYAHASVGIEWQGIQVYLDPASKYTGIDFSLESKADIILVTHHHSDHLDIRSIANLSIASTKIFASRECSIGKVVVPGDKLSFEEITIEVVPAYNTTPEHLHYHPQERLDCGYVLTLGGTRIYIAGDTEDNEEVLAMKDIDILFLPVNQPFTMTCEQAKRVIEVLKPSVFYPYHTGDSKGRTDIFEVGGINK